MVKLKNLRKSAIQELSNCDSPSADVDSILVYMGFSKSDIIIGEKAIDPDIFNVALERLKKGEPVQYITGGCEFMSLWFEVNPATLIPRCDTEILVESVIDICRNKKVTILDIGTGSGCIAVSLAHYLPDANIVGIDISTEALETAERNAHSNGVSHRCQFEQWDIMKEFPSVIPDVVVSNPPYIPLKDIYGLDSKVKDFEPLLALEGGKDGLDFYRRISLGIQLAPGGILAFEVGINQASEVAEIMSERFENIEIIKDLSGIDRVVIGYLKK